MWSCYMTLEMKALASQGRLKDIVTHDCQRTLAMPELSVNGSDRTQYGAADCYADVVVRRSEPALSMPHDDRTVEPPATSEVPPPAPLQRLKQLESELALLNHVRRRLAVDNDRGGHHHGSGGLVSSPDYCVVTHPKTEPLSNQVDESETRQVNHNGFRARAAIEDVNMPSWYSPPVHNDKVKRRQMCGGTVFSSASSIVTDDLQTYPLSASAHQAPVDVLSSRFALERSDDLRVNGSPRVSARTTSDWNKEDGRKEELQFSVLQRSLGKEFPQAADVYSGQLPLQTNSTNCLQQQNKLEDESSGESHDGQDDIHVERSNAIDHDRMNSGQLSPPLAINQDDNCMMSGDGLRSSFWMTDYKQPKRCKKGNCTFHTVSKVEFWEHLSVHFTDDKLFRCDRCPFRTPLKHHMTSHRMNHDDDKPFACDVCSYRAVSQSMVNSHKKSHSTARPYICDYPHCHYATKFVNQLSKHREKQHPGYVVSSDGAGRRRRPSDSMPLTAMPARRRCYPDSLIGGFTPPVFPPPTGGPAGVPALTSDAAARNAMLQWSMSAGGWSPFHFLQRMAGASGLPLCPPSLASSPADIKPPYKLPHSMLPSYQSLESVTSDRGLSMTPRKPAPTLDSPLRMMSSLSTSTTMAAAADDVDPDFRRLFTVHPAAVSTQSTTRETKADDDGTSSPPAIGRSLASSADGTGGSLALSTNMAVGPCQRSDLDNVVISERTRIHLSGNGSTNASRVSNVDDHPLDLTAKPNLVLPANHLGEVFQSADADGARKTGAEQSASRKTSRRKGIAHKMDTTCNRWLPVDVKNEPFDLVRLPASPKTVTGPSSGSQLPVSQQSSSTRTSSPGTKTSGARLNEATGDNGRKLTTRAIEEDARQAEDALEQSDGGSGTEDRKDTATEIACCRRTQVAGDGTEVGDDYCYHCGLLFKHPAMYDIHMGFHQFDDPWRCNRCGQRCTDCVDFNRHIAAASHFGQV